MESSNFAEGKKIEQAKQMFSSYSAGAKSERAEKAKKAVRNYDTYKKSDSKSLAFKLFILVVLFVAALFITRLSGNILPLLIIVPIDLICGIYAIASHKQSTKKDIQDSIILSADLGEQGQELLKLQKKITFQRLYYGYS